MEQKEHRRAAAAKIVCLCLVCALLGGAAGFFAAGAGRKRLEQRLTDVEAALAAQAGSALSGADIYDMACGQAVGIQTEYAVANIFGTAIPGAASGTGFVISGDGYVLTNYHIVEKAVQSGTDVSVLLPDGSSAPARIIGCAPALDLAVVLPDAAGLRPVTVGDSAALRVGERVYAVGNNLGEPTLTLSAGTVSALDRVVTASIGGEQVSLRVFQMDTAINSGSSGGPVYNDRGEVVGIVTAKYTSSGVEGLGFAIPISDAMRAAEALIRDGFVRDLADLGAVLSDAPDAPGAAVDSLVPGGCGDRSGLLAGDVITAVDGRRVSGCGELAAVLKSYRAGDSAALTVVRGDKTLTLDVVFDAAE